MDGYASRNHYTSGWILQGEKNGIFKNTLFSAVYGFLLAKYNNEQEALFCTVYKGRQDKRLARTVGMFVKTLPVFMKFTDDTTTLDFLKAGQEQISGCREHDTYTFTDVMTDLNLQMGSIFSWQASLIDDVEIASKPAQTSLLNHATLNIPLYVQVAVRDGHFYLQAEYNTGVYSELLVSQFLESYETVLDAFLQGGILRDINITTDAQLEMLDSFNQTDVAYDNTQTIVSLFRQQAKAMPDNIAVVFKQKKYTYKEVDEISDRIAGYIVSRFKVQGSSEEPVVSVLIPRCEWMAIASLGVLKAGCAYQPLDPSYPQERLNFMMQDACAQLLIADEELRPLVNEYQARCCSPKTSPVFRLLPRMKTLNCQLSTLN